MGASASKDKPRDGKTKKDQKSVSKVNKKEQKNDEPKKFPERHSKMLHNDAKNKYSRQMSCVPVNRGTLQRTRITEGLVSKNVAAAAHVEENGEADKEKAHALANHLISISPFNKRWKVIETINEGTFGVVFSVQDIITETFGVIKVAKNMPGEYGNATAEWEAFVLEKMFKADTNNNCSVVRLLDRGMLVDQNQEGMEFMVLEKAEIPVQTYIYEETGIARRVRVCQVAIQILKAIHDLHIKGLLHRDLKPDNMGICSRKQPIVLLYDLEMARMYTQYDGTIRPPRTTVHFRGTPEWASGHALKSREQTRWDDLIAWLYIVVEFFNPVQDSENPLPWSYVKHAGGARYLKSAYAPARLLLRHCPSQFYAINTYLLSANRNKAPDYAFLADRVVEAMQECKNEQSPF